MSAASNAIADDARFSDARFFGHPKGLSTLFFSELWERFSYYGMRALLILYMTADPTLGGLGYDTKKAALIYGTYTSSVYLLSIPGGWAADKFLGGKLAVFIGGIIIALGHFTLAFKAEAFFFTGLVLIVLGTGLLKPNISAIVGTLYKPGDVRRDAGFSIFYMGINIGALVAPLVCGFLAQPNADTKTSAFREFLKGNGIDPNSSWHWGFAAAGVGMTLGLVFYLLGRGNLAEVGNKPKKESGAEPSSVFGFISYLVASFALFGVFYLIQKGYGFAENYGKVGIVVYLLVIIAVVHGVVYQLLLRDLSKDALKKMIAVDFFFATSIAFWALFEQAGSSLNLFADRLTNCNLFGWSFPASYYQSVNSGFIILLAPLFSILWIKWGKRQPSSPAKFSVGLLFVALGFFLGAFALGFLTNGKVGPWWLIGVYLLHTIGELCLSPVGLSTMTKLAPERLNGFVMGIWFLGPALGNYVGGLIAGHFDEKNIGSVGSLFNQVAFTGIAVCVVAAILTPIIKKLMGEVR